MLKDSCGNHCNRILILQSLCESNDIQPNSANMLVNFKYMQLTEIKRKTLIKLYIYNFLMQSCLKGNTTCKFVTSFIYN